MNWAQATSDERHAWSKLLAAVIRASADGNDEHAAYLFSLLGRAFGGDAVVVSLIYLANRAASPWHAGEQAGPRELVGIDAFDGHGHPCDIEEMPYPARWSARMVAAAANDDHDALSALIEAAADDGQLDTCVPLLALMAAAAPTLELVMLS